MLAPHCTGCTNADILTHVYYTGGPGDVGLLQNAVRDAVVAHCPQIRQIQGVDTTYDPCPSLHVSIIRPIGYVPPGSAGGGGVLTRGEGLLGGGGILNGDDDGGLGAGGLGAGGVVVVDNRSVEPSGIGAGGAVGIAMAGLFLVGLLAFLAMRRRRRNKDVVQENLGNTMEDTFLVEERGNSRDEDSRFGMYPDGQTDGMILGERSWNQDVHKCSSATCELCERRRKNGLQFLPAKCPPDDEPPKDLLSEDTVNL